jgi:hypothetical protein
MGIGEVPDESAFPVDEPGFRSAEPERVFCPFNAPATRFALLGEAHRTTSGRMHRGRISASDPAFRNAPICFIGPSVTLDRSSENLSLSSVSYAPASRLPLVC